ncbi:hypothetical protein PO909_023320 [Leuciscus waleckii]
MACTRRTKTLVSTCVILSGMTNIVCLLYVGWVTNYIANVYIKVPMPVPAKKLEGDRKGETLRIIERLDRLENVVNQHIQGKTNVWFIIVHTNVTSKKVHNEKYSQLTTTNSAKIRAKNKLNATFH